MKSNKTVSLVLLCIILAFVILLSFHYLPSWTREGFDTVVIQGGVSTDPTISAANVESNNLIHSSPNEQYMKQYVMDNVNNTFTNNEYDMKIIAVKPAPTTPVVYPTSPPLIPSYNPNLNFAADLSGWAVSYFPDSIVGLNGIGITPTITVKNGTDSYGFTFPKKYVQIQFTGFSQYNFNGIIPFITLQTSLTLNPGYYTLSYDIQTRPGLPIDKDSRTIGIMAMANTTNNIPFLFSTPGTNGGPRTPVLTDETKLTPQSLKFYISKADAMNPVVLSFVFIVSDPKVTNNCTVAIGDIELLNCQYNSC
jgi:hypothetical protein